MPRNQNQYQQYTPNYSSNTSHSFIQPYSTLTSINSPTNNGLIESLAMAPKINQIVNSVFAMNQAQMQSQLYTCSKIVTQLLQNNFIGMATPNAVKLICFELVLMIAQQESAGNYAIDRMRNSFEKNRELQLTVSVRNTLAAINEILQEMMWKQSKKKHTNNPSSQQMQGIYKNYLQYKALLAELDNKLSDKAQNMQYSHKNQQQLSQSQISIEKTQRLNLQLLRQQQQQYKIKQEQNQALIEQMQQIIAKKQKRIKQISSQLQENILQQKNMEDMIEELENRNYQLNQDVKQLTERVAFLDQDNLIMKDKISQINAQNLLLQKQLNSTQNKIHKKASTQKNIRNPYSTQNRYDDSKRKHNTQIRDILFGDEIDYDNQKIPNINGKIDKSEQQNIMRMLYTQAVSIQALI